MRTLEQERHRRENMITWSLFIVCIIVFGVSLTYAINKAYSSGEYIGASMYAAEEAYNELFSN